VTCIAVEAYLVAGTHQLWFTFDKATIHIRCVSSSRVPCTAMSQTASISLSPCNGAIHS
jgi:hypothetical protein